MTETFTASNGRIRVDYEETPHERIDIYAAAGGENMLEGAPWLGREEVSALRDFFQHERDEALGRWRDPDNPRLTVYPTEGYETDEITILDEVDAETYTITRAQAERSQGGWWHDTAKAYFEAHPERKPAAEAKAGEVWELTIDDGSEHTVFIHADRTMGGRDGVSAGGAYFDIDDASNVVSARKVWGPEDAS